jgi:hypothetical protein
MLSSFFRAEYKGKGTVKKQTTFGFIPPRFYCSAWADLLCGSGLTARLIDAAAIESNIFSISGRNP